MNTSKIENLYAQVINIINKFIPDEWSNVKLYAEIEEGRGTVIFYYYPIKSVKPIYSLDIEDLPNIDKGYIELLYSSLYDSLRKIWNEFKKQKNQVWTSITMDILNNRKFDVNYDYSKLNEDKADIVQRQILWKYQNIGIKPTNKYDIEFLKKYLNKKEL